MGQLGKRVYVWLGVRARLNLLWQIPVILVSAVPLALVTTVLACLDVYTDATATAVRFTSTAEDVTDVK